MFELAQRFSSNPILRAADIPPSRPDFLVQSVLNPGAFRYQGRIGLLLRVAERPPQEPGWVSTPVLDPESESGCRILRVRHDSPHLNRSDPRLFCYRGQVYLTTLSHLRLAWSDDGERFTVDDKPTLQGDGPLETFGIEDCRVSEIDERYWLTYSAVSSSGYGVGLISTADWVSFDRHGMIFTTPNKDCAIIPCRIGPYYYAVHRPSSPTFGGHYLWTARSKDLLHWGDHRCIATTRAGMWDSARLGAGAAPIWTEQGWLEIYHGATDEDRYCLGLMLLDHSDPTRILARSIRPILEPEAEYEREGFFGGVVFTNGHVVDGSRIRVYYGAADSCVCGAQYGLESLLQSLKEMSR
jgi:predicted GH43/DUF377 family glycosyl hydrolase